MKKIKTYNITSEEIKELFLISFQLEQINKYLEKEFYKRIKIKVDKRKGILRVSFPVFRDMFPSEEAWLNFKKNNKIKHEKN